MGGRSGHGDVRACAKAVATNDDAACLWELGAFATQADPGKGLRSYCTYACDCLDPASCELTRNANADCTVGATCGNNGRCGVQPHKCNDFAQSGCRVCVDYAPNVGGAMLVP